MQASDIEPAILQLLDESKAGLEKIAAASGPRTYDTTLGALEHLTVRLEYAMSVARHLEAVVTTPELRAAYNAVQPPVSGFYSRIPLHEGIWKALQAFAATPEAQALTGTRQRLLKKTLDSFRRAGAELDPAGKQRLAEIDVELTTITTAFSQHVLDSTNAYELLLTDEAQLEGLPESARAAARQASEAKGQTGWRFTLHAPSYIAVMTYLRDAGIREQMYRAFNTRAYQGEYDNATLLERILLLRHEKACLLGFRDFADLVLADRMAGAGERAQEFVEDLRGKTEPRFRQENAALQAYRDQVEGVHSKPLQPWDIGYYAEKQREAEYGFDDEELRPYFPVEQVVQGLFQIVERLFGARVTHLPAVPTYHPEAHYYEIHDLDGALLGSFYADWHPRDTKRGGAWMDALLTGGSGVSWPHVGVICGNLTAPLPDKPALLTHREVETIFHEFGHLLHHCLSRVEVRSLSGTNVAWDFVELPSQIMENWCWERESLDLFARHYETGATIPEDLFQKMRRARTFRGANGQMRQLGFAILDLTLHRQYNKDRDGDVISYVRELSQEFASAPLPNDYAMIASFTHLFSSPVGYGAGYYSYKWAEVLDADAFTRFLHEGIFNPQAGHEFRRFILERGDSEDPAVLYRSFMGRDPDPQALLARLGLAA